MSGTPRLPVVALLLAGAVSTAWAGEPSQGPAAESLREASLTRPRVALVLGGGSARGLAHLGVLRWFEEHRIPVDLIVGSSMGGLIGGLYATGTSSSEIEQLLLEVDWDLLFQSGATYRHRSFRRKQDATEFPVAVELGLKHGARLPSGLNPGHHIGLLLSRLSLAYSDAGSFDELPIPFRCVATDLERSETHVFSSGQLGQALRASMAFPGIFDPVRLEERLLADGGVLDNVPVDVAQAVGADKIVAVSVSAADLDPVSETLFGVVDRAVGVMMDRISSSRLAAADILIAPELAGLGSVEYTKVRAFSELGYAAAEARSAELLPLALDPQAWAGHLQARQSRRRALPERVESIAVTGVPERRAAEIAAQVSRTLAGRPFDPARVEAVLDTLVGEGRYASAAYSLSGEEARHGLAIALREKAHAPPTVNFSIDINNQDTDFTFAAAARTTFFDLAGWGSEWRLDTALGARLGIGSELLVPVGRTRLFLAPRASYFQQTENRFENRDLVAVFERERGRAGVDAVLALGRSAEWRGGYAYSYLRSSPRIGDPLLPSLSGHETELHSELLVDHFDAPFFARRGFRLQARLTRFLRLASGESSRTRASGQLSLARGLFGQDRLLLSVEGGTSLGRPLPDSAAFTLGGPSRLSAYGSEELRGPRFGLAQAAYLKSVGKLPSLVGDRLFVVGLVESGSVFVRVQDARIRWSGSLGIAAETSFGPFFVGGAVGDQGAWRLYASIGRLLR